MKHQIFVIFIIILNPILCFSQITEWEIIDDIKDAYPLNYEMRYMAVDCADDNNCIAVGNMSLVWPWNRVTSDGGKTWFTTLSDSSDKWYKSRVFDVSYPDTNLCIIVGDSNLIWISTDKCATWKKYKNDAIYYDNNAPYFNISMANRYFGGMTTPQEAFLTNDGGNKWDKILFQFPDSLMPLAFLDIFITKDSAIFILVCNHTYQWYIIRSFDGGKQWSTTDTLVSTFEQLYFIDKNEGWLAGRHQIKYGSPIFRNLIYHTNDGGTSWQKQLDTLPEKKSGLNSIHFSDKLNGVANGYYWNTWITTDGGKKWELDQKSLAHDNFFMNVFMLSNHEIIGVGSDGYIFKSKGNANEIDEDDIFIREFSISPNPASDFIEISIPQNDHALKGMVEGVRIYNVFGEEISTPSLLRNATPQEGNLRIDVSGLPAGVYFVRIGEKVEKFVKM